MQKTQPRPRGRPRGQVTQNKRSQKTVNLDEDLMNRLKFYTEHLGNGNFNDSVNAALEAGLNAMGAPEVKVVPLNSDRKEEE